MQVSLTWIVVTNFIIIHIITVYALCINKSLSAILTHKRKYYLLVITGHYVPQLAELVYDRNKDLDNNPYINLKGFIVSPLWDPAAFILLACMVKETLEFNATYTWITGG